MIPMYARRVALFLGIVFRDWNGVRVSPRAAWEIATTVHDVPWNYGRGCAK